jgi:probable rRNA maturation factor
MDSDGPDTVVLTVAAAVWRTAIDRLEERCLRIVRQTLAQATTLAWLQQGEVSILLCADDEISDLNARYRQQERPTNVLSFPNFDLAEGSACSSPPPGPILLGDIAMSYQRLAAEAGQRDKSMLDHFGHLLVHGTLHLLGYDHQDDDEAAVMERMEERVLASLGMAAPYAPGDGADALGALP